MSLLNPPTLAIRTLKLRHATMSFIQFTFFFQRLSEYLPMFAIRVVFPVGIIGGLANMIYLAWGIFGQNRVLRSSHLGACLLVAALFAVQNLVPTGGTAAIVSVVSAAVILLMMNLLMYRCASQEQSNGVEN